MSLLSTLTPSTYIVAKLRTPSAHFHIPPPTLLTTSADHTLNTHRRFTSRRSAFRSSRTRRGCTRRKPGLRRPRRRSGRRTGSRRTCRRTKVAASNLCLCVSDMSVFVDSSRASESSGCFAPRVGQCRPLPPTFALRLKRGIWCREHDSSYGEMGVAVVGLRRA